VPAPLAVLKGAQVAKAAVDKSGIPPGVLIGGAAGVVFGLPIIIIIAFASTAAFLFGSQAGTASGSCQLAMGNGVVVPANYSFVLPNFDPNPASRGQTRDPNALPGPVPTTYDNRGMTVPYLQYMKDADQTYHVPWYMLAAISWQETRHGADAGTWDRNQSPDHSYGPMQFIPGTFGTYGVDGDHDGRISDESVGDQIFAAANLLVRNGFLEGPAGVLRALSAYNPHPSYTNDVLFWAQKYAAGAGGTTTVNNELCNSLDSGQIAAVVRFALDQVGKPYVFGTEGPDTFDCSGLTFAAFHSIGITLPRRAVDQADSDMIQIVTNRPVNQAALLPGDLLFIDNGEHLAEDYSQRLKAYIGHVAMYIGNGEVVEAFSTDVGIIRSKFDAGRWSTVVAAGRVKGILVAGGAGGPWAAPVIGAIPTSGFGNRPNPTGPGTQFHNGQDLAAPCGTPIYAVADATVLLAGPASGYGNYIVLDHGSGFHTGYGHEQTVLVRAGQQVHRGQQIANVGSLGDSTGCHLHFNTVTGGLDGPWSGTYVDPKPILIQHGADYWGTM
jgi:cell wall-associated NlpC family hydrolase